MVIWPQRARVGESGILHARDIYAVELPARLMARNSAAKRKQAWSASHSLSAHFGIARRTDYACGTYMGANDGTGSDARILPRAVPLSLAGLLQRHMLSGEVQEGRSRD